MIIKKHNRGFTAFFAVLVSALALAVGISMYDLLSRELLLSQTSKESQYAVFAADTGAECALYWDSKAPVINGSPTVFGTSTSATWGASGSGIKCNLQDIATQGPPKLDWSQYVNTTYGCVNPVPSPETWCRVFDANAATTTFRVTFSSPASYCAVVVVAKWGNPSQTTITSHGYNTCGTATGVDTGAVRLERALQVSY